MTPTFSSSSIEEACLSIARSKVLGSPDSPYFQTPYLDAAFNGDIFLWDTCMMAAWAKYHPELPIAQALDNFYRQQRSDGFISRQYAPDGNEVWDSRHPISVNPPLLAWAEWELHESGAFPSRLAKVYPALVRFHRYLEAAYRESDGLFFSDAHGSGMDNITRSPRNWIPDQTGIALNLDYCHPKVRNFATEIQQDEKLHFSPFWNRQGRSVDFSAQMALDANHLSKIAAHLRLPEEATSWTRHAHDINETINRLCWDSESRFYCDLGYGKKIHREHIGMFWTLWSGAASDPSIHKALANAILDSQRFGRPVPIPSLSISDPEYVPWGDYWRGGVWAPTNYMVLRGLKETNQMSVAIPLAQRMVDVVEEVFRNTGTLWENYAPEFSSYGLPARPDFCGWTPLIPIAVKKEFLQS